MLLKEFVKLHDLTLADDSFVSIPRITELTFSFNFPIKGVPLWVDDAFLVPPPPVYGTSKR
tara:strand:+ start:2900 stop:3082 length:183 start_codon:yes stop_codon:yes gene_type:complete